VSANLMIGTLKTSGTSSGAAATVRIGQVYAFRGARISAVDSYYTADEPPQSRRARGVETPDPAGAVEYR